MSAAAKLAREDLEERPAFLGVTRSVKEQIWRERLTPDQLRLATVIGQKYELPDLLGRILAARGATLENVPDLMAPTLRAMLPDPSLLQDMDAGAARFAEAIQKSEKIAVLAITMSMARARRL